ncbi:universal stress protein [Luedemannella flava]|uniref:Universal stress protein n=1 Tax=Luedemannella flava TaxID=349316 RepID=A0ABP4Y343_9ACTN
MTNEPGAATGAGPVVVGVDGSPSALDAVAEAVREATMRRRALRIVHAYVWPLLGSALDPLPTGGVPAGGIGAAGAATTAEGGLRQEADQFVAEAVTHARQLAPDVAVTGQVITGPPAAVLVEVAHNACLVVLGDRGLGGFTGLLVGSIAIRLAAHAPCPVLVVRGAARPDGPVAVGVERREPLPGKPDGNGHTDVALGMAFEEAALRGVPLRAVSAWRKGAAGDPGSPAPGESGDAREWALAAALAPWRERYPQVAVEAAMVQGRAGGALVDASEHAQLLVVGARGRGGFKGLLLGSISQAVLHHAACPVLVVRRAKDREGRPAQAEPAAP